MRIIMVGATGLVGGLALKHLTARPDLESLTTITRSPITPSDERHFPEVAPMAAWSDRVAKGGFDIGICCLGTTIKAAGSKQAFAAVDMVAVGDFALACKAAGARQFMMVSSVGADAHSRNFYLSTKGKAEASVRNVGFERVDIFRPGLLVGRRKGAIRLGESVAIAVSPLTDLLTPNVLSRYRSVKAEAVAKAITSLAGAEEAGHFIHHNDEIRAAQSDLDKDRR